MSEHLWNESTESNFSPYCCKQKSYSALLWILVQEISAYLPLETRKVSSRHSPEVEVRCVLGGASVARCSVVATTIHRGITDPPQLSALIPLESLPAVTGIIIWLSLRPALAISTLKKYIYHLLHKTWNLKSSLHRCYWVPPLPLGHI